MPAPTGLKFKNWHSAHTVFVFLFTSKQTALSAPYNINWLVFITEMKSVYSAVRTDALNKAVCASSLKGQLKLLSSMRWHSEYFINLSRLLSRNAIVIYSQSISTGFNSGPRAFLIEHIVKFWFHSCVWSDWSFK